MDAQTLPLEQQPSVGLEVHEQLPVKQSFNLADCLDSFDQYGGMRFIKALIRDAENMDPQKKALHNIFLSDPHYIETRERLTKTLDYWIEILEKDDDNPDHLAAVCLEECKKVEKSIAQNLFTVREEIKQLEITYRELDLFFKNTGQKNISFLSTMNVNKGDLHDFDTKSSQSIIKELNDRYDSLDLKDSYSLMVMPGFLESVQRVQDWAGIAHRNKVLLVTDFEDSQTYDDLMLRLEKSELQRPHRDNSSLVVACNYILARKRSELSDEFDDLFIPGSAAIAGKMTDVDNIPIAQGIAGRKYGSLNQAPTVRCPLLKAELTKLIDMGVVPLVEVDGQVLAFSNRTPYIGKTSELQEYPIVRVFDWVSKVIQQFCNDEAFVIWDSTIRKEMEENLERFLSKYKGAGKLYEDYFIKGINRDSVTGNILVQVEIKPFFAAENFLIELTGRTQQGKMTLAWEDNLQ